MAQDWKYLPAAYDEDDAATCDLTAFMENFAVLQSHFSGTAAPSATYEGQLWFDTDDKIMKIYNGSTYKGLMYGSADAKIWAYLNSAPDGWVYDSSITDRLMAVEGGTVYTSAASGQGTWEMTGLTSSTDSHNHQWYYMDGQYGWSYDVNGDLIRYLDGAIESQKWGYIVQAYYSGQVRHYNNTNLYTEGQTHQHTGATYTSTWRPAAAVGILVYPNL